MGHTSSLPNKIKFWLDDGVMQKIAEGRSPLDFLIEVYQNLDLDLDVRIDAAKACLPYICKRAPTAVEIKIAPDIPIFDLENLSDRDLKEILDITERISLSERPPSNVSSSNSSDSYSSDEG